MIKCVLKNIVNKSKSERKGYKRCLACFILHVLKKEKKKLFGVCKFF